MSDLLKKDAVNVLKGFSMGTGVFPGVSAGTIALITGIFQPLLDSLDALLTPSNWKMLLKGHVKEFSKAVNLRFLVTVGIGTLAGFVLLARLVEFVLARFPVQTWAFFFGLILVSTIWLLSDIKKWRILDVFYLLCGIALGIWLCLVSPTQTPDSMWFVALSGALGVVSMILPGAFPAVSYSSCWASMIICSEPSTISSGGRLPSSSSAAEPGWCCSQRDSTGCLPTMSVRQCWSFWAWFSDSWSRSGRGMTWRPSPMPMGWPLLPRDSPSISPGRSYGS